MPAAKKYEVPVVGTVVGRWTVVGQEAEVVRGNRHVRCRCSCGEENSIRIDTLMRGGSKGCRSCASSRPRRSDNLDRPDPTPKPIKVPASPLPADYVAVLQSFGDKYRWLLSHYGKSNVKTLPPVADLFPGLNPRWNRTLRADKRETDVQLCRSMAPLSDGAQMEYYGVYAAEGAKAAAKWLSLPRWKRPFRLGKEEDIQTWKLMVHLMMIGRRLLDVNGSYEGLGHLFEVISGHIGASNTRKVQTALGRLGFDLRTGKIDLATPSLPLRFRAPWEPHDPPGPPPEAGPRTELSLEAVAP